MINERRRKKLFFFFTLRYESGVVIPSEGTGFREIRQETAAAIRIEIGKELPELEACRYLSFVEARGFTTLRYTQKG